jgi:hypothetical protein
VRLGGEWSWLRILSIGGLEGVHTYFSPNINSVVKSGRMMWTGHVARMGIWYLYT